LRNSSYNHENIQGDIFAYGKEQTKINYFFDTD